ncbi:MULTISPECIES: winged helix-turn-helix domain-containing protein [Acetobacter]|uniref:LysR family transcriptional regulator n=1 Tax=Acetobacter thailandicus TaxID=1502842 RepID=A0ABT3QDX2_9PROT|nr:MULTISPECIES: LysR family transcriptional regulator [Acetobacter]MBS0961051.1 LysR family transcriptional regulator [Acetobacter thailandicus]MBS0981123.1 LysR family transcriptional regulator [Acetobacter thailandicus]MBS0986410.1 LysR family transcriptional regulator [Acetobacter thailandicus]MBS1004578.1 LysR family transcriptional regulator [Acetobacter thailandicus]MCX2563491.1 LysR family transcriptional regulator [Acetobacter thailandicus]
MPEVRLTLRLDADDTPVLGHGKIRLLEKLAETGSISAAGRAMGMSYRRTWLLVDSLNQLFSSPVVTTRTGGGGGATVTQLGLAVLALYRKMEAEAAVACAEDMARLRRLLAGQKTKT